MKKTSQSWFWPALVVLVALNVVALSYVYLNQPQAIKPATASAVAEARALGIAWLENNFTDEGIFLYSFNPVVNEVPKSSNALRQLMASRVAASESPEHERLAEIHLENLTFVLENWYQEDAGGAYVDFKNKSKLGANAMLLRTLVYSPHFDAHKDEAAELAKGIRALQQTDGSFVPWYIEPSYEYDGPYLLYFYSGEAILALLEYHMKTGDLAALESAKQAAEFYLGEYVEEIEENYHPAYVPWHTMALRHLYSLTGERRYAEATFVMNDRLLELLDTETYQGRFYKKELEHEGQAAPHSSSDAVYLEGLLFAYELAVELEEPVRAEGYKDAIDLIAGRLIALQYQDDQFGFAAETDRYIGALPIHEANASIRVDTTQHMLDAFEKYLELFEE